MIRDEHIDAAVSQGVISAEQAARLRAIATGSADETAPPTGAAPEAADPDDERFRLIGGFNDVFVTIGVLLLVAALFGLANALEFKLGFAALAMIIAWGLAEFFSRRMRLALPSIALSIMFTGAAAYLAAIAGGPLLGEPQSTDWFPGRLLLLAGLGSAVAALVHERRFRVPIDAAIMACGTVYALAGLLSIVAPDFTRDHWSLLLGLLGIAVFAVALRFDASDPMRQTRRADVAFWLHLVAAPMIVHAAMPLFTGQIGEMRGGQALGILLIFAVLGLVAIVIDRRALLVSGLTYAGIAIGYLLSQSVEQGMGLSLTLLLLAGLVLGLSAGWRSLRHAIVPRLPLGKLGQSIPPA
jgi:hypothetical protein